MPTYVVKEKQIQQVEPRVALPCPGFGPQGILYVCAVVNINNRNRTLCSNSEANSVGRKLGREPMFRIFRDLTLSVRINMRLTPLSYCNPKYVSLVL